MGATVNYGLEGEGSEAQDVGRGSSEHGVGGQDATVGQDKKMPSGAKLLSSAGGSETISSWTRQGGLHAYTWRIWFLTLDTINQWGESPP